MGYTCNKLIPAAILLYNPGITKEEFVELLNETHSSGISRVPETASWKYHKDPGRYKDYEEKDFHDGLHGLAKILRLPWTEQYQTSRTLEESEFGIPIGSPNLLVRAKKRDYEWTTPEYEVDCAKIVTKSETPQEKTFIGLITKRFETLKELLTSFPQFNPDFMYDFSASEGKLYVTYDSKDKYYWKQENKKYYLDKKTFDQIPAGGQWRKGPYSSLVLTAEAVKQKAWKLLTYRGDIHTDQFFADFPKSRSIFERAVWDAQTSVSARLQNLSHTEFLRCRLLLSNAM